MLRPEVLTNGPGCHKLADGGSFVRWQQIDKDRCAQTRESYQTSMPQERRFEPEGLRVDVLASPNISYWFHGDGWNRLPACSGRQLADQAWTCTLSCTRRCDTRSLTVALPPGW